MKPIRKLTRLFLVFGMTSQLPFHTFALDYNISGTNVNYPTQEQIAQFYHDYNIPTILETYDTYEIEPSPVSPYIIGALSSESIANAIATTNYIRYVAGISYTVTANNSYNNYAQAGSLVNAANNVLSHTPTQPSGMTDTMYDLGYTGTSSSNLSMSPLSLRRNISANIISGWMNDGDSSNIDRVGHRRWVLNPVMMQTGFGSTKSNTSNYYYHAMYSFDSWTTTTSVTGVAWPAQNTPTDLFTSSYPWTFSTGQTLGDNITVTLTRLNDDKVWTFDSSDNDTSGKYFNIENSNYGQKGCIIFRPNPNDITYSDGDIFNVSISGDYTANYFVSFFEVDETTPSSGSLTPSATLTTFTPPDIQEDSTTDEDILVTGISLNKSTLTLTVGESEQLIAKLSPDNATYTQLNWSTSSSSLLSVDDNGNVKGLQAGSGFVQVSDQFNDFTAICLVTIVDANSDDSDSPDDSDDSNSPDDSDDSDSPDDSDDSDSPDDSDDSDSPNDSTEIPMVSIQLNASSLTLAVGDTFQFEPTIAPSNTTHQNLLWSVSNSSAVTMDDETGTLTAIGTGSGFVQVSDYTGNVTALCFFTIDEVDDDFQSVTGLTLDKSSISLSVGDSRTMSAYFTPTNATNTTLTWTSSNSSVATVNVNTGRVVAQGAGTAFITATSHNGISTTCKVTVTKSTSASTPYVTNRLVPVTFSSRQNPITVTLDAPSDNTTVNITVQSTTDDVIRSVSAVYSDGTPLYINKNVINNTFLLSQIGDAITITVTFDGEITTPSTPTPTPPTTTPPTSGDWYNPYSDVRTSDWFYGSVELLSGMGLMSGVEAGSFHPYTLADRGTIVSVLYNMEGQPTNPYWNNPFYDVLIGDPNFSAIVWAKYHNIVMGVSNIYFSPADPVTREQFAVMLYSYQNYKTVGTPSFGSTSYSFTDYSQISDWASTAVQWCASHGLISGRDTGAFDPKAYITRGEVATIYSNFIS